MHAQSPRTWSRPFRRKQSRRHGNGCLMKRLQRSRPAEVEYRQDKPKEVVTQKRDCDKYFLQHRLERSATSDAHCEFAMLCESDRRVATGTVGYGAEPAIRIHTSILSLTHGILRPWNHFDGFQSPRLLKLKSCLGLQRIRIAFLPLKLPPPLPNLAHKNPRHLPRRKMPSPLNPLIPIHNVTPVLLTPLPRRITRISRKPTHANRQILNRPRSRLGLVVPVSARG